MGEILRLLQNGKVLGRVELNKNQIEILLDKLKELLESEDNNGTF